MARGSKIKKIVGKRGVSYRTTVDVGMAMDPKTGEMKRKQKVLTAKSKTELENLINNTLADVSRGEYFEPKKMTTEEYLDYWMKNYAKTNVEKTTYEDYETTVNLHLKPAFGVTPISRLTSAHIQDFIGNQLENGNKRNHAGLSPKTVLMHFLVLKEALSHAVKWEIVPKNVCDAVTPPKKSKKKGDALTAEQADTIVTALKGTRHDYTTRIALYTAMRVGEILGLQWKNVNLDEGYLYVLQSLRQFRDGNIELGPPKTESSKRRIDLVPEAVNILKARKAEIAADKLAAGGKYKDYGYVFSDINGKPYAINSYSGRWSDVVLRRTGIKSYFHQLRHTAATLMLEAGVPLHEVSRMLGHSSVSITGDIYGHVTPAGIKNAADKLAEALAAGRK